MRELKLHTIYRHFKGRYYLTEDIAYDSESCEELVLYRALYGDRRLWVRPLAMFLSEVDRERYPNIDQRWRFEEIDTENQEGSVSK